MASKRITNQKLIAITGVSIIAVAIGGVTVNKASAYISEKKEARIEQQKIEEERRKEEEERKRFEEEAKKAVVGVHPIGKEHSYDAKKVWEKLSKYDYSNNGEKVVFLTFDDGSSTTVTPKILDTLEKEDVKATFFITGANLERGGDEAKKILRKTYESGHAIANHSYSHDYKKLYPGRTLNLSNFKADIDKNEKLIKSVLGDNFSTKVLRCPGGFMSWRGMDELKTYLNNNGMASIDWNALNKDAEGRKKNAEQLYEEAIKSSEGKEMVVLLMHDTYGKEETAKALPKIIEYYKSNGYTFKTLV